VAMAWSACAPAAAGRDRAASDNEGNIDRRTRCAFGTEAFEISHDISAIPLVDDFVFQRPVRRSVLLSLGVAPGRDSKPRPDTTDVYTKCSDDVSLMTYMAITIGVGTLDLSEAVAKCGYIPGIICLLSLAGIHLFLACRIIEVPYHLQKHDLGTFGDIAKASLPECLPSKLWMLVFMLGLMQWFGSCSIYLTVLLTAIDNIFCGGERCVLPYMKMIIGMFLIYPAFKTKASDLMLASKVSLCCMFMLGGIELVCALIFGITAPVNDHDSFGDEIGPGIRDMMLAFSGVGIWPFIVSEMLRPQQAKQVAARAIGCTTGFYTMIAMTCYFGYGVKIKNGEEDPIKVLNDNGGVFSKAAVLISFFLMVKTVATFPLYFWPLCREVETYFRLEDMLCMELGLPWAFRRVQGIKASIRVGLLFLTVCPTFCSDYEPFKEFMKAVVFLVQFFFPSWFAVFAIQKHLRILGNKGTADGASSALCFDKKRYFFGNISLHVVATGTLAVITTVMGYFFIEDLLMKLWELHRSSRVPLVT